MPKIIIEELDPAGVSINMFETWTVDEREIGSRRIVIRTDTQSLGYFKVITDGIGNIKRLLFVNELENK